MGLASQAGASSGTPQNETASVGAGAVSGDPFPMEATTAETPLPPSALAAVNLSDEEVQRFRAYYRTEIEGTAPKFPVPVAELDAVDLVRLDDDHVALFREMVKEARRAATEGYDAVIGKAEAELVTRMHERRAKAIPSFEFKEIALKDQWSEYAFDLPKLREAAALLPETERSKVVKHIPEAVTIVPAHDEPGNPVSIAALIRKYGEDAPVGKLLAQAMTRSHLGEKLVIRAFPPGTP